MFLHFNLRLRDDYALPNKLWVTFISKIFFYCFVPLLAIFVVLSQRFFAFVYLKNKKTTLKRAILCKVCYLKDSSFSLYRCYTS